MRTLSYYNIQIQTFFTEKTIFSSTKKLTPFYFGLKQLKYALLVGTENIYDIRNW